MNSSLLNTVFSKRMLSHIPFDTFRKECEMHFQTNLKEYQFKQFQTASILTSKSVCEGYRYTASDFAFLKEVTRFTNAKIFLTLHRNIALYEETQKIKTIWYDQNSTRNRRGEHFKALLNE